MFEGIVRNGVLVAVGTLILCVLGVLAAMRIPVQMIPDLEVRTISVETRWPGATPQDIEREILIEQEEFLRNIPYLQKLRSTADFGSARIELEFPFGVDITQSTIRVINALTQVPTYPLNVDEPRVIATSFSSNAFMYFRISPLPGNPRQLDINMMRDYLEDHIRPRLSSVPGVAQVDIWGGASRQIQIRLDTQKLAEMGMTIADIRSAINARNRDISGGEIESGKRRYLLRTIGRFEDLEALRQLILRREGDAIVRLGDVAEVVLDHSRVRTTTYFAGQQVLGMSVRRESGSNVIRIKKAMMEEVARVNRDILEPAGLQMARTADDVVYVQGSLVNVWKNLLLGALLATGVMYLFLKSARTTALGVIGIPVCTIAAFLGLLMAGRTINVISLAGVAFAIGMTLDNSVVVLESIEEERKKGHGRLESAIKGVSAVWPAVLASTLTTVMVFLPVVFIAEEAGQLYSDVAIAISAAILTSMLVAIVVIPTASAHMDLHFAFERGRQRVAVRSAILGAVGWLLETPQRRLATIAVAVATSAAIAIFLTPPAEYLPEGEEAKTFASLSPPPGYNLATMERIAGEIDEYLRPATGKTEGDALPDDLPDRLPGGLPPIKYAFMIVSPQRLLVISEPEHPQDINALMQGLVKKYETYPGMRAFAARGSIISSNDGGTRSVSLDISGPDLAKLYEVARKAYDRAREIFESPSIQTEPSSLALAQPLLQIEPDWERAAELGMSAEQIGFSVAALTDGAFVNEFFYDDDKIDIYLFNRGGANASIDTLESIFLETPAGVALPLSDLTNIRETVDTSTVRRVSGSRTITLNIIPPRSVALETGVERVREQLVGYLRDNGEIPAGVSMNISGAADQLDATRESLSNNYLVALIIIYLLMVAIFTHWGYPLLIMTTIPLGIAGGLAGLALLNLIGATARGLGLEGFHQPFDMISMLGFLILMGTVVNNPILIVHTAAENVKTLGMSPIDAVQKAVSSRLRPIAISSITTIFGIAPLVLLPGAGTELYRGVGVIVMAGIIASTVVTLTALPALTTMALRWQARRRKARAPDPEAS
ncbi:efflux RND transporter permease subunit [Biformimicrobium ophioploci]|uniref:Efflux RND transporter permease subunit n=1 Tax=Biformimicrobium ophioploci TaxID=3036711 RepID=A0ABQ6LZ14_9GAMM|nr:efflux RND transporter permease subunit [Microbulbifer sp. NKW57]GMG87321.1 efflux RND transporter permease subunit [Microbulbifer sp. NKW57]